MLPMWELPLFSKGADNFGNFFENKFGRIFPVLFYNKVLIIFFIGIDKIKNSEYNEGEVKSSLRPMQWEHGTRNGF